MICELSLVLLLALAPFRALAHTPEEEAGEIRESRLAEIRDRTSVFQLPIQELGDGGSASPAPGNLCKYASWIAWPPPPMEVALTFDDGPGEATAGILDTLAKFHATATFFQIGLNAQAHPELVALVTSSEGMNIGNHSWTHPDFHKLSPEDQATELHKNAALLGAVEHPKFFRYPYGNSTCETNALAHSLGYQIVGWHVDSCDWAFNKTGAVDDKDAALCEVQEANRANFLGHVVERLKSRRGGILLMHEIQPNTIKQLNRLLERLVYEGFTFTTLSNPALRSAMK